MLNNELLMNENGVIDPESRGSISEGYHTFDELYDHRCLLFAMLMRKDPTNAWKSKKHFDEDVDPMYPGYFIVGLETPHGAIRYHYHMEKWDYFAGIKELDNAPECKPVSHKPLTIMSNNLLTTKKVDNSKVLSTEERYFLNFEYDETKISKLLDDGLCMYDFLKGVLLLETEYRHMRIVPIFSLGGYTIPGVFNLQANGLTLMTDNDFNGFFNRDYKQMYKDIKMYMGCRTDLTYSETYESLFKNLIAHTDYEDSHKFFIFKASEFTGLFQHTYIDNGDKENFKDLVRTVLFELFMNKDDNKLLYKSKLIDDSEVVVRYYK
ncbi:MAG: hypothetical protein ACRC92_20195 [Peptostreptococcaceae bacterium]